MMRGHEHISGGSAAFQEQNWKSNIRIEAERVRERNVEMGAVRMVPGEEYNLLRKGFSG